MFALCFFFFLIGEGFGFESSLLVSILLFFHGISFYLSHFLSYNFVLFIEKSNKEVFNPVADGAVKFLSGSLYQEHSRVRRNAFQSFNNPSPFLSNYLVEGVFRVSKFQTERLPVPKSHASPANKLHKK